MESPSAPLALTLHHTGTAFHLKMGGKKSCTEEQMWGKRWTHTWGSPGRRVSGNNRLLGLIQVAVRPVVIIRPGVPLLGLLGCALGYTWGFPLSRSAWLESNKWCLLNSGIWCNTYRKVCKVEYSFNNYEQVLFDSLPGSFFSLLTRGALGLAPGFGRPDGEIIELSPAAPFASIMLSSSNSIFTDISTSPWNRHTLRLGC